MNSPVAILEWDEDHYETDDGDGCSTEIHRTYITVPRLLNILEFPIPHRCTVENMTKERPLPTALGPRVQIERWRLVATSGSWEAPVGLYHKA